MAAEGVDTAGPVSTTEAGPAEDGAAGAVATEGTSPAHAAVSAGEVPDAAPDDAAAPAAGVLGPAEVAARLGQHFPALFGPGVVKPIKLRVHVDIQQRAPGLLSRKSLSNFLHRLTMSTPYLKAMVAAEHRVDLDGAPAGEIDDEHREAARQELERRREVSMARRRAQRSAGGSTADGSGGPRETDAPGAGDGTGRERARGGPVDGARPGRRSPRPNARSDARPDVRPEARPDRRGDRPGRPRDGGRPADRAGGRPPRGARGDRDGGPRPPRSGHDGAARGSGPRSERPGTADLPLPEQADQRERALLLRAWETSPLTKANFCALKGLDERQFDTQLALAQQERQTRGQRGR